MDTAPEQNPQPAAPAPVTVEQTTVMPEAKAPTSYGAILGIIVIVAALIAGAFYVWNDRIGTQAPTSTEDTEQNPSVNVEVNTPQPQ